LLNKSQLRLSEDTKKVFLRAEPLRSGYPWWFIFFQQIFSFDEENNCGFKLSCPGGPTPSPLSGPTTLKKLIFVFVCVFPKRLPTPQKKCGICFSHTSSTFFFISRIQSFSPLHQTQGKKKSSFDLKKPLRGFKKNTYC